MKVWNICLVIWQRFFKDKQKQCETFPLPIACLYFKIDYFANMVSCKIQMKKSMFVHWRTNYAVILNESFVLDWNGLLFNECVQRFVWKMCKFVSMFVRSTSLLQSLERRLVWQRVDETPFAPADHLRDELLSNETSTFSIELIQMKKNCDAKSEDFCSFITSSRRVFLWRFKWNDRSSNQKSDLKTKVKVQIIKLKILIMWHGYRQQL